MLSLISMALMPYLRCCPPQTKAIPTNSSQPYPSLLPAVVHAQRNLFPSTTDLVEGVGAGSPPGEEASQTDGLDRLGQDGDGDGLKGPVLLEDLGEELRGRIRCWISESREGGH